VNAHIVDGDIVILDDRKEARNGDIVAALIDGETTLKRFVIEHGRPYLRAENPRYPDQRPARDTGDRTDRRSEHGRDPRGEHGVAAGEMKVIERDRGSSGGADDSTGRGPGQRSSHAPGTIAGGSHDFHGHILMSRASVSHRIFGLRRFFHSHR